MDDVRTLAEQLDGPEAADTSFGYPPQKHAVYLPQAYTLLGDTRAAYRAQDEALALTISPSVMTRALIAMDTAACLRVDGDSGAAAAMAAVYDRLPPAYRRGLVHSRAQLLHRRLEGAPHRLLGDALACRGLGPDPRSHDRGPDFPCAPRRGAMHELVRVCCENGSCSVMIIMWRVEASGGWAASRTEHVAALHEGGLRSDQLSVILPWTNRRVYRAAAVNRQRLPT